MSDDSDDLARRESDDLAYDGDDPDDIEVEIEAPGEDDYEPRTFTYEEQNKFLRAFEQHQCKRQACREADVAPSTVEYAIKNSDRFNRMYQDSKEHAAERLLEEAYDRAINGYPQPVFQNGEKVGERIIKSDKLLKELLESYVDEVGGDSVEHDGEITINVQPPE